MNSKSAHKQIFDVVSESSKVDSWVHDSNHGYRWQKFENLLAFKCLNENGILVSDDIDASSAWREIVKSYFRKSDIIFDSRNLSVSHLNNSNNKFANLIRHYKNLETKFL
jgi:hypothetical protein